MTTSARFSAPATFRLLALALVTSLAACGGDDTELPQLQNRLWLSKLPTSTRDAVGALIVTRAGDRKQYGALYRGSVMRGSFELFEWQPDEHGRGHMRLLQDDRSVKIRTESCTPDAGFEYCVLVHGDPLGETRYQSRKRWGTRPKLPAGLDLAAELRALAEVDAEVAAAIADLPDLSSSP